MFASLSKYEAKIARRFYKKAEDLHLRHCEIWWKLHGVNTVESFLSKKVFLETLVELKELLTIFEELHEILDYNHDFTHMMNLLRLHVNNKDKHIKSWNECVEKLIVGLTTREDVGHLKLMES